MSMIKYFLKQLRTGELPNDPFEKERKRTEKYKDLSEDERNELRNEWNTRLAKHFNIDRTSEYERRRWATQRALRALRSRFRR